MNARLNSLNHWLRHDIGLTLDNITVASADASFRSYYRVTLKPSEKKQQLQLPKTVIAMDSPPEHEDNALFVQCSRILADCDVNTPQIYATDLKQGFLLITDLGETTYLDALNQQTVDKLYEQASSALHAIQSSAARESIGLYDTNKLLAEMQLFDDWYIGKHHHSELSKAQQYSLKEVKQLLVENALQQPQVLVHRDYHSRNLLVCDDVNLTTPGIIDYQDMVIGPITYDLVSLLKDCYIEWSEEQVTSWALDFHSEVCNKLALSNVDQSQWLRWFDLMGVQRHLKILGIFCRLFYRDHKNQYMDNLPLTYDYLLNACIKYPELNSLTEILKKFPVKTATLITS